METGWIAGQTREKAVLTLRGSAGKKNFVCHKGFVSQRRISNMGCQLSDTCVRPPESLGEYY